MQKDGSSLAQIKMTTNTKSKKREFLSTMATVSSDGNLARSLDQLTKPNQERVLAKEHRQIDLKSIFLKSKKNI